MTNSANPNNLDGIAIIGMAGKFPGASGIDEFWNNIRDGVESITFFSDDELDPGIDAAIKKKPNYVKARGIIKDVEKFDAALFGISPREAEMMDPQHRIFLEIARQALEDGAYDPEAYDGLISVYGGAGVNTYFTNNVSTNPELVKSFGEHQAAIANAPDYLTSRVSYKLNLRGPSVSVYTGCSSSLVAVCYAVDSLMSHQSDMALAGGVFVHCPQNSGYLYEEGEIYSNDGHCRPFDSQATGTVFSNGAGIVLIKRWEDALQDGDSIYAVIRGTAVNNDGSNRVSFTAPSISGQAEVIAMAQANADVDPATISYIEAHGTGTPVGDPIEIAALTQAFRARTSAKGYCAIGSLKSNIGHLDAAAGIAGLIKTVLALKHKVIPPNINFEQPNPNIDFSESPFFVNTKLRDWNASDNPRRAGVSSFGVGGTNAHVILEEAPEINDREQSRAWQMMALSGQTDTALETNSGNIVDFLKQSPEANLADVAYTLQVGRKASNHRRIAVCQDVEDAITALETNDPNRVLASYQEPINRSIAFIFSGQGSQYLNMGLELYKNERVFRENVDRCSEILLPHTGVDLRDVIYPRGKDIEESTRKLTQTLYTQPALFTIEYALAKLWMSWGIQPEAMVGHSIGEYVAACLAGVFTLEDALSLVAARCKLMGDLPGGSMLAVFLPEDEIRPFLDNGLSIAVINGPSLCVVSGEDEAIENLVKRLSGEQINQRRLHTSHAFHSVMMEPIVDIFAERVKGANPQAPQIPFISNVTGIWITPEETTDPNYWAKHLRQTVRFSDCLHELLKKSNGVFLEVGPGNTFSTLIRQHPAHTKEQVILSSLRHPKEEKSDMAFILNTLGQLWLAGIPVDWAGFYADENRRRLPLPTYSLERQRHWIEAKQAEHTPPYALPVSLEPGGISESEPVVSDTKTGDGGKSADNQIEEILANIWKETLGIKHIGYNDNFFDLGGHSLMAVRMFVEIEKVFGKKLPLSTLYQASNITQLAAVLRKDKTNGWSSLVEIQSGNTVPPFFCVHAGGGNVLIFHDLVRYIGEEQPFFGLQSQGLDGEHPFRTQIVDMAAQYVQEIKAIQSEGPYFLGGFCMGGTIALEMALQLQAEGQEVALLVVMETYNWNNQPPRSFLDNLHFLIQKAGFNWNRLFSPEKNFLRLRGAQLKQRIALLFEMIKSKHGFKLTPQNGENSLLYLLEETNEKAADNYQPDGKFRGKIISFVPEKQYTLNNLPELSIENMATEGVEEHPLPFYPRQMINEPFVSRLADELMVCIRKKRGEDIDNEN